MDGLVDRAYLEASGGPSVALHFLAISLVLGVPNWDFLLLGSFEQSREDLLRR